MALTIEEAEVKLKEANDEAIKLRNQIQRLKDQRDHEELRSLRCVAEKAHNLLCPYNHTDGCSWGYETNIPDEEAKWANGAHLSWLRNVKRVQDIKQNEQFNRAWTVNDALAVLECFDEAKRLDPRAINFLDSLRRA